MRILLPLFAALFAAASAAGQNVTWTGTAERLDDNAYRIVLEAAIPAGYHMYDMGPYDGGPNATTITFTPNEDVTLEGGVEQLDTPHRYFDELFGMERLSAVLNKNAKGTPEEILSAVKADIDLFVGSAPQFDDITMLCLEYKQKMEESGDERTDNRSND